MLRRAGLQLLAARNFRAFTTSSRLLEEEVPAAAGAKEFEQTWAKLGATSTLGVPEFNSNFYPIPKEGESQVDGDRFPVNLYTPDGVLAEKKLDMVLLPGAEGYFGVKANHVPYIAQLKPGLVELHDGAEVTKYFISGGFAFVHPNSVTDVCVLEAATLDQFDGAAVKQALTHATSGAASDEYEAAVNRAATELYQALDAALEGR